MNFPVFLFQKDQKFVMLILKVPVDIVEHLFNLYTKCIDKSGTLAK